MQELLEKSIIFATEKHMGQIDKSGQPYILHPLRVMNNCSNIETKIVAVLHDILEDTDAAKEDLLEFLPEYLVDAIVSITKINNEAYEDYLERVSSNYYATQVKLMDLKDNMNLDRLNKIEMKDMKRYLKYRKAVEYLSDYGNMEEPIIFPERKVVATAKVKFHRKGE
ncbi:GTP pyrophosphokinase [Clostridium perfringens]|jgi:(p)ppGpp synthase/HD superfamily hydrolase|uniref:GTP pyrophosphokinase n=1 Tax=Clostridium perfringens TaxID=1502 RepID=A0AAW4IY14_CLOPF|nr:GTP pyrophosphokinase [Clostridium perfringens]MBO3356132.1 GTP pyrophosphokinase [Clostridium perfringens]MBO3359527.1 GTP pyrophosphokinase [Clostridium perfringens]